MCWSDWDCPPDHMCLGGMCVYMGWKSGDNEGDFPETIPDNNKSLQRDNECAGNQDCPPGYACVQGKCEPECGSFTISDIDGNTYGTVQIGKQCWMAENLKTTRYSNGTPIEYPGTDTQAWVDNTTGAYAWYNNNADWKEHYGALYNWHVVNNPAQVCPQGWRLPDSNDFEALQRNLGGGNIAGGKLKSTYTEPDSPPAWSSPNTGATNESGFSGLPGGNRAYNNGDFLLISVAGSWWLSAEEGKAQAFVIRLGASSAGLSRPASPKNNGFSIRCIKN
jgi:uncharacterized protein (TIGR02145 family)